MWTQTSDEENSERNQEIDQDFFKAQSLPKTIIGRKRLRALRKFLKKMGINVHVMYNSAMVTDEYCLAYGKKEPNDLSDRRRM